MKLIRGYLGMGKRMEKSRQKKAQRKGKMFKRDENLYLCFSVTGALAMPCVVCQKALHSGGSMFGFSTSSCLVNPPCPTWHSGCGLGEASNLYGPIPHLWCSRKYLTIRCTQTRVLRKCGVQPEISCFFNIYISLYISIYTYQYIHIYIYNIPHCPLSPIAFSLMVFLKLLARLLTV